MTKRLLNAAFLVADCRKRNPSIPASFQPLSKSPCNKDATRFHPINHIIAPASAAIRAAVPSIRVNRASAGDIAKRCPHMGEPSVNDRLPDGA
jgi:hypothetical protein